MEKRLEGKIAVITGGNSGIGLATAQRFVEEGAYVFIIGRRESEVHNAVNQIGENVTGVQGDVSNLADLDRLYASVKQQKGRIGILFANAGVADVAPLGSITEARFDKIFDINVKYSPYKRRFRCFKMAVLLLADACIVSLYDRYPAIKVPVMRISLGICTSINDNDRRQTVKI